MRIPKHRPSETESKLTLLACVSALECADEAELWTFIAERELMEYLPMRLSLGELLESGELARGAAALSGQIYLTDKGRETLTLFAARVPAGTRARIRADAPGYRARLLQRRQVRVAYDSAREGEYRLRMTLTEGELPTLCLLLQTARRALADRAGRRFEGRAPELMAYLYGLSAQEPPAGAKKPDDSQIVGHSVEEYTATVRLSGKDALLEVTLLLPSRDRAEAFVVACEARRDEAAARLLGLLCGD